MYDDIILNVINFIIPLRIVKTAICASDRNINYLWKIAKINLNKIENII